MRHVNSSIVRLARCEFFILAALTLTGCASVMFQTYPGPARPRNDIAVLRCGSASIFPPFSPFNRLNVYVAAVDGREPPETPDEVAMLPGRHTITFVSYTTLGYHGNTVIKDLDVEAGKSYLAKPVIQSVLFDKIFWHLDITEMK